MRHHGIGHCHVGIDIKQRRLTARLLCRLLSVICPWKSMTKIWRWISLREVQWVCVRCQALDSSDNDLD